MTDDDVRSWVGDMVRQYRQISIEVSLLIEVYEYLSKKEDY